MALAQLQNYPPSSSGSMAACTDEGGRVFNSLLERAALLFTHVALTLPLSSKINYRTCFSRVNRLGAFSSVRWASQPHKIRSCCKGHARLARTRRQVRKTLLPKTRRKVHKGTPPPLACARAVRACKIAKIRSSNVDKIAVGPPRIPTTPQFFYGEPSANQSTSATATNSSPAAAASNPSVASAAPSVAVAAVVAKTTLSSASLKPASFTTLLAALSTNAAATATIAAASTTASATAVQSPCMQLC